MFVGRKMLTTNNPRWATMNVAEVLRSAAQYILDHGWNRGQICDPNDGTVCALGAIAAGVGFDFDESRDPNYYEAAYDFVAPHPAVKWFANWIEDSGTWRAPDDFDARSPHVYIYRYNDLYIKTDDEIVNSLRAAADSWEHDSE